MHVVLMQLWHKQKVKVEVQGVEGGGGQLLKLWIKVRINRYQNQQVRSASESASAHPWWLESGALSECFYCDVFLFLACPCRLSQLPLNC
jgi:hypothetical protein